MRTALLSVLIAFTVIIGCSSPEEPKVFIVEPTDGVSFEFEILKIHVPSVTKNSPENQYQSLDYRLTLRNNTGKQIYFNPGEVKLRINGVESLYTGPQGLGSGEWRTNVYPTGSTALISYTVFPEELLHFKMEDIKTLTLEASGLEDPP